jgi:hypothetical protein
MARNDAYAGYIGARVALEGLEAATVTTLYLQEVREARGVWAGGRASPSLRSWSVRPA